MSKFVVKHVQSITSLAFSHYSHNLFHLLRIQPFCATSASLKSINGCLDLSSFTVKYLINSCGLTPERAILASNYVKLQVADNADSVLNFFKDQGFTQAQISKLVNRQARLLLYNPKNSYIPKIEFLKSKGVSSSDIVAIICRHPGILTRSLEKQIIPSFSLFSDFIQSHEKTIAAFKRYLRPLWFDNTKEVKINIEMLKQVGAPFKNIRYLVTYQPNVFMITRDKFGQAVDEVKKLGFNPSKIDFVLAVHVLSSMSKSTWDSKVEVYKQWGWSDDDIFTAFRKNTWCMALSEHKINSIMDFWVSKLGWKSSFLANNPKILSYSLEKRIVPRCEVYQFLVSNSLLKPGDISIASMLKYSENRFRKRFIDPLKEEAPDTLKLYEQKLGLTK